MDIFSRFKVKMEKIEKITLNIRPQHTSGYFVGGPMVYENAGSLNSWTNYRGLGGNIILSLPLKCSDMTEHEDIVTARDHTYINAEFTFVAASCNLWLFRWWED